MSRGSSLRRAVAGAVVLVSVVMGAVAVVLGRPEERALSLLLVCAFLVSPVMAAVLLIRRPENRIGWLFAGMSLSFYATMVSSAWVWAARGNALPGQVAAAWLGGWLYAAFLAQGILLIALFPTGRLASRVLVPIVGTALVGAVASAAGPTFGAADIGIEGVPVANPLLAPEPLARWLATAGELGGALLIIPAPFLAATVVIRLLRARGIERQQLKWFVAAAALVAPIVVIGFNLPDPWNDVAWVAMIIALGAGLPLAAGIAILRYRLYDIDVVIRRTVVYTAVVGVLAVVYATLVLASQAVLSGATGSGPLPVALSTLAVAALFGPVRARVREAVDRRFYRSRYDAQRTLEAFGARLRDEVELDAVGNALVGTAGRSVRPAAVGLWLRSR
jgi:hypothetical protein